MFGENILNTGTLSIIENDTTLILEIGVGEFANGPFILNLNEITIKDSFNRILLGPIMTQPKQINNEGEYIRLEGFEKNDKEKKYRINIDHAEKSVEIHTSENQFYKFALTRSTYFSLERSTKKKEFDPNKSHFEFSKSIIVGRKGDFDKYKTPNIILEKEPFKFVSNQFKIYKGGRIVNKKYVQTTLRGAPKKANGVNVIDITHDNHSLLKELKAENTFDKFATIGDRVSLFTIPRSIPSGRINMGLQTMTMLFGTTRASKEFSESEPYIMSFFTQNSDIKKVTLSFSYPEKLIEFNK